MGTNPEPEEVVWITDGKGAIMLLSVILSWFSLTLLSGCEYLSVPFPLPVVSVPLSGDQGNVMVLVSAAAARIPN